MKKTIKKIRWSLKNIALGPQNLILRGLNLPLKPRWLVFMVTDRCNSCCSHCSIWQQKQVENLLTPKEIEEALRDKLFKDVEYVLCTGGELTLRQDLEDIILGIHRALPKAIIQMSTNALLPEQFLNVVKSGLKQNIIFDLGVSLDGIGKDHDKIRGVEGNFKKADYLFQELVKLRENHKDKIHISAEITLSDITLPFLKDVRSYTKGLNIDLGEAWYNEASFYKNVGKNKFERQMIEAVKSQPPSPLKEKWIKVLRGRPMRFPCFALNSFCVLKCNGDIAPCLKLWDFKIGNIRQSSFVDIWQSLEAKKVRKVVKNCQGCLNSWGNDWSFVSSVYPILLFGLKHPKALLKKLKERNF